jgi:very-short-patch-repair endonuclease
MVAVRSTLEIGVYQDLRERLVDRSRRNRLLNFRHTARAPIVRVIDAALDRVLGHLRDDGRFRFRPLPDPEGEPQDEHTAAFRAALSRARVLDEVYRVAVAALDLDDPSAAAKEAGAERELRDRLRSSIGLPPRQQRRNIETNEYARSHGLDPVFDMKAPSQPVPAKHTDDWLRTLMFTDQLRARLASIHRNARAVEQETGVNTLHLAFAFLEWFEDDSSREALLSPLLLLPVGLERRTIRGGEEELRLVALDGTPTTNLSLELRLRDDFRVALPSFDPDASAPVESYITAIAHMIQQRPRWRIRRFLTLAPFSFARIAMFRDLDLANWEAVGGATEHPLVRPILRGTTTDPGGGIGTFAPEYSIDDPAIERLAPVLIHDADSSQHSAIIDAMQGRSLVIEGPPGTGKSQTIANLIANALHQSKTVLFVSEKMAALDVVKSRLDKVGLGHFCLTLHASGAKPSVVIDALRSRAALGHVSPYSRDALEVQIQRAKAELGAHVRALHTPIGPNGETAYSLIGRLTDLARVLPDLPRILRSAARELPERIDSPGVVVARERLEVLEQTVAPPKRPEWNPYALPFRILERVELFQDEQDLLFETLALLSAGCVSLMGSLRDLTSLLCVEQVTTILGAKALGDALASLHDPTPEVDRDLLCRLTRQEDTETALWLADLMDELTKAADCLRAAGVSDPATARPDALAEIAHVAQRLSLTEANLRSVATHAAAGTEQIRQFDEYGRIVAMLVSLLSLDADPSLEVLRLACTAVELVSECDTAWLGHRRIGLHRHAILLMEEAGRQEAWAARLKEVGAYVDVQGVSPMALRMAAETLRHAGLFGFIRGDVREAKQIFATRWRGGPVPRPAERVRHLDAAADVLSEREQLASNVELRTLMGRHYDLESAPLREMALAAGWQFRIEDRLAGDRIECGHLRTVLVSLSGDKVAALIGLADAVRRLREYFDQLNADLQAPWTAVRKDLETRGAVLMNLVKLISGTGLLPDLPLSEVAKVAVAAKRWQSIAEELRSPRANVLPVEHRTRSDVLRATARFAASVQVATGAAAHALLADGWRFRVSVMRDESRRLVAVLGAIGNHLHALKPLGLGGFTTSALEQPITEVLRVVDKLREAQADLVPYLEFAKTRASAAHDPFAGPVVRAHEAIQARLCHLPEALDWLLAWTVVRRKAGVDREIFTRAGAALGTLRRNFAQADRDRLKTDAISVAAATLQRRVPHGSSVGSKREWTDGQLLQNEFSKHSRHITVRDLLARAGNSVLALTPCLMMSPLTVAQYLKPGQISFDLVVMDEASQIKPEDAVGALLRGRQTVIVGDPKQLPPTNFFDRALDDAENEEEEAEDNRISADDKVVAESVLDLATRAFQPARRLRWHYRSQHESLIAFSNREFYDHDLVVFPAAQPPSETLGIEVVQIDGAWRERVNVEEAQAVAGAVASFMRTHPSLSHGVVAMNQPQRELIEAEIDRLTDSSINAAEYREYWEARLEPPFIKNLENVQGDERDVIFISLGWGRTTQGAMHQRFFPINRREDGHRRLNVLFTRAKRKLVLFVSLRPEDIVVDPERTARGVRVLRDYLFYARDGRLDHGTDTGAEADSPFETSVANALRARGHDVALQVGVAGYRIDIAARHPQNAGRFVLGIECDGAAYHSSKSARDRDRLRQEALERLGWRLTRVWSTDWFRNAASEADRISAEIYHAISIEKSNTNAPQRLVRQPEPRAAKQPAVAIVVHPKPKAQFRTQELPLDRPNELPLNRPNDLPPQAGQPSPDGLASIETRDLAGTLRSFRETVIMRDLPGSEPNRCILREEMIKTIVQSGLDDPTDFHEKIPQWFRSKTDGRQIKYLEAICDIAASMRA